MVHWHVDRYVDKRVVENELPAYRSGNKLQNTLEKELVRAPVRGDATRASTLYDLVS